MRSLILVALASTAIAACEAETSGKPPPPVAAELSWFGELVRGLEGDDCKPYFERSTELAGSADFAARFGDQEKLALLRGIAICGLGVREYEVAFKHADRATAIDPEVTGMQLVRLRYGLWFDRVDASVEALRILSRIEPKFVRSTDLNTVVSLVRAVREADPNGEQELEVLEALERVGYVSEAPHFDDWRKMGHARLLLQRHRIAQARALLRGVADIHMVIELRVNRLFDPLRNDPTFQDQLDLAAATERYVERSRHAMTSNPHLMEAVYLHSVALSTTMRLEEGLSVIDGALNRHAAEPTAFSDTDKFRHWLLNMRGDVLYDLGRIDVGRAALAEAASLDESGKPNVSNAINFATKLLLEGRPQDALDQLSRVGAPSPFGRNWIESTRTCAGHMLGDGALVRDGLEFLRANETENPAALTNALLCTGDLESAAAHMIRRLENDETRAEALLALQITPPRSDIGLPHRRFMRENHDALRARSDVKAAAEKVGRIEVLPVGESGD
jgi:tetratricopeptide (TPR) repeat protein